MLQRIPPVPWCKVFCHAADLIQVNYFSPLLLLPSLAWAGDEKSAKDLSALSLKDLLSVPVITASLHPESLHEAPANVTVITAEQIRQNGYGTLAEAVTSLTGMYQNYDYSYRTIGVRGFSLPGEWGNRVLVLLNGHAVMDNIYDANPAGMELPVELSLVSRIEVIKGPSSALYGSSGVLATINIITVSPAEAPRGMMRVETGTLGERKAVMATGFSAGKARVLLSGSVFNNRGVQELYIPEYDRPETNFGRAVQNGWGERLPFFRGCVPGAWDFTALAGTRRKTQPLSWGDTIFNDPGTHFSERRKYLEASYSRHRGEAREFRWRTYYDGSQYTGFYRYVPGEGREYETGDWVGTEVTQQRALLGGIITVGGELRIDLRARMRGVRVQDGCETDILNLQKRDRDVAAFAQQEWSLGAHWTAQTGARLDFSRYRPGFVSPKAGWVWLPNDSTTLKFLYGRSFRRPSLYELFRDDGFLSAGNADLQPEKSDTFEVSAERRVARKWTVCGSGYWYDINRLIEGKYLAGGLVQYQNSSAVRARGVEFSVDGEWRFVSLHGGVQVQTARYRPGAALPDSPDTLATARVGTPLWRGFRLAGSFNRMGSVRTLAGDSLPAVSLLRATIRRRGLFHGVDLEAGARNLANSPYANPVGLVEGVDRLRQPGRTYFLALTWVME